MPGQGELPDNLDKINDLKKEKARLKSAFTKTKHELLRYFDR